MRYFMFRQSTNYQSHNNIPNMDTWIHGYMKGLKRLLVFLVGMQVTINIRYS